MGIEYKIKFDVPTDYNPASLFKKLPNPIDIGSPIGIYDYSIEPDGFYFIDHLGNLGVASVALRCFIDEALLHAQIIEILEP